VGNVRGMQRLHRPRIIPQWIPTWAFGVGLVIAGVALMAWVTPLDNVIVHQTGHRAVRVDGVAPGQSSTHRVGDESQIFRRASLLDVSLSFTLRLSSSSIATPVTVVSTFAGHQGMAFEVTKQRALVATVGGTPGLVDPTAIVLTTQVPVGRWMTISGVVDRNQSLRYRIDGGVVQSFTWNLPLWNATPKMLRVSSPDGILIRNVSMNVTTYGSPTSIAHVVLIRLGQTMAILAIVGGTILILRRFVSTLIPVSVTVRQPLVRVAFGTMGVGIFINILVDWGHFQKAQIPYFERNTWLYAQYPRFNDFFQVYEIFRSMNPYGVQNGSYPPLGYWLVSPVAWLSEYAALFVLLAAVIGFLVWWFARSFSSVGRLWERVIVTIVAMLSLPTTFAIDRGNVDLILFIMLVIGIAALERNYGVLSASVLGLMAATKVIPVLFLFVFLRGRRLRLLVLGLGVAVLATLLAFLSFHGSLGSNISGFRTAESALQNQLNTANQSTAYNASIYGWIQSIGYAIGGESGAQAVRNAIASVVTPLQIVEGLILAWYLRWKEESLWRGVALITLSIILFTGISNYYIMLLLFVPLALFVKQAEVNCLRLTIAGLFGIALAPRAYFYLGNFIDVSVLSTAPILLALTAVIIYDGMKTRRRAQMADPSSGIGGLDASREIVQLIDHG
jgi:glycosyl transferase family 87